MTYTYYVYIGTDTRHEGTLVTDEPIDSETYQDICHWLSTIQP